VISDNDPVAERSTWAQSVNGWFARNTLLADTALILLCQFSILVLPGRRCKLLRGQTDLYGIPKISLPLSKSYERIAPKEHLDKVQGWVGWRSCYWHGSGSGRRRNLETRQHVQKNGLIR